MDRIGERFRKKPVRITHGPATRHGARQATQGHPNGVQKGCREMLRKTLSTMLLGLSTALLLGGCAGSGDAETDAGGGVSSS
ncbi:MAG TPA: hypothetical protein DIC23_14015, partial [Planctomycetaceae bacterium]|nr:hypothetical protein [Planctomycetaceae bacterium]